MTELAEATLAKEFKEHVRGNLSFNLQFELGGSTDMQHKNQGPKQPSARQGAPTAVRLQSKIKPQVGKQGAQKPRPKHRKGNQKAVRGSIITIS